jgi:hypothetical protein
MSSSLVQWSFKIKLRDAVAAWAAPATTPTDADPNWIPDSWRSGVGKLRGTAIAIFGSDASADGAGAVVVSVYTPLGWVIVATLDGGAAINVGDGSNAPGRLWVIDDVAAMGTALQVSGGAISGGTLTVWAAPIEAEGVA